MRPFESDIPNSTVVAYDGVAVGTEIGIRVRPVAGRFDLTYDFGTDEGQFNLNIGSVQASTRVVGSETRTTFSGAGRTANSVTQVTGAFFSGGGNPVAATGGEFQHDVTQEGNLVRRTVGIFAGDAR